MSQKIMKFKENQKLIIVLINSIISMNQNYIIIYKLQKFY